MILFISLTSSDDKTDPGLVRVDLSQIPRWCPLCRQKTIVGHGQRRKQAHDAHHDWIWVRRGRCPPCRKTFTILPIWSPPYGHYSLFCRQQAWESACERAASWEESIPQIQDPVRLPDPSTLRRWASRKLVSIWQGMRAGWFCSPEWLRFLQAPTILAWDWAAAGRILRLEAISP